MTPPSKVAKNDHISIKFNTHIKMAIHQEKMKKMAKIGPKLPKLGQKWPKLGIFIDFLTFFKKLTTLRIFFSQTSLTPEMKDLKSLFHIK